MARIIPAPLKTALTRSPLAGECVVLRAIDGTVVGFTTLARAQTIDLTADGGPGPVACDQGMVVSAVTLSVGLDGGFAELRGPLGSGGAGPALTRAAVEGGRWKDAEAWLVRISPGQAGYAPLLAGKVREARVEDPRFVLELRSWADIYNQVLEETITPYCKLRFASAECGAVPISVAGTVTAVTDAMRLTISYTGGDQADNFFNAGEVEFLTGALIGIIAENLFKWDATGAGTAALTLLEPLPATPGVGDTLQVRQGCPKTRPACVALQGGDAAPFRGFPDVPGEDVLLYPTGTGA